MITFKHYLLSLVLILPALCQDPIAITPYQVMDARTGVALPCIGCQIYTYAAGTNTPSPTYTDHTLNTTNTNPVLTNSAGYAVNGQAITGIWVGSQCLKVVLQDANSVVIWTQDFVCDSIQAFSLITGASKIGFSQVGGIATTVQAALRESPASDQYTNLQAALDNIPTNGYLTISGTNTVVTGLNLSASNVTLKCDPGAVFQAGNSSINMLSISGDNVTVDGCLMDGQFSQGRTTVTGISISGSGSKTVRNSVFRNMDNGCISIANATGSVFSRYNQFQNIGRGLPFDTNFACIGESGTSSSSPHLQLFVSDHDTCNNLTTGDCIHMFNGNVSSKEIIRIDSLTCILIGAACAEGATQGAKSVTFINPQVLSYQSGNSFQAGISWQTINTDPTTDNDSPITVIGGNLAVTSTNPYGHGRSIEAFTRHLQVSSLTISAPSSISEANGIIVSGGAKITDSDIQAVFGVSQDPTFTQTTYKVLNNTFNDNCSRAVSIGGQDIEVGGNTMYRTPSICPADGTDVYASILATTAPPNPPARVHDNMSILRAGTAPGGTCTSGFLCYAAYTTNGFVSFRNNSATDLNMVPFFAGFGPFPETFTGLEITGTRFTNMGYAIALGDHGASSIRVGGNLDLTGNLTTQAQGDFILDNFYMPTADLLRNVCNAWNVGNTLRASDSNTNTWGDIIAGSGADYVTAQCRYSGAAYAYTIVGK